MRGSDKEFKRFLSIANGSGAELETQIMIAKDLNFAKENEFKRADILLVEVMKMLNKLTA